MDEFPYKTTFAAQIRALQPTADDIIEAKASLNELKALLPPDAVPEDEPTILYVAANLAVAGVANLNDDALDIPTALAVYKKFEKQQVNIEHNRDKCVGFIIKAGLSELGTDRLITEDEARAAGKPFNIATVAVLWRLLARNLCDYIEEASTPAHPDFGTLSLSFEMGFKDYAVASISGDERDLAKASRVVKSDDVDYDLYSKALRANKGTGRSPLNEAERVYRVMPQSVVPLGQGIVAIPAAAVRGLIPVTSSQSPITMVPDRAADTEEEVEQDEVATVIQIAPELEAARLEGELAVAALEKNAQATIISARTCVLHDIDHLHTHIMSVSNLQQVKDQIAKAEKVDDFRQAFAGLTPIMDKIAEESERLEKQNAELSSAAKAAEQAKTEAAAAHDQLKAEFAALRGELDNIRAAQATAQAEEAFNRRMTALEEVFDLDDETRAFFAEEVKSCESDEAFAKKMDKFKKLMKEKTKDSKKSCADASRKKAEAVAAAFAAKGIKVTVDADTLDFTEIIASAQANPTSTPVDTMVQAVPSLAEQAREAFADMTIGGKKISEIVKK